MTKIKEISIYDFRNLHNAVYYPQELSFAVKGNNGIGKTNFLNAVYWCLTGTSLDGSSDNAANVPYQYKSVDNGTVVVNVELKLNEGIVRRTLTYKDGSLEQTIYINGIVKQKKQAEVEIDKMLGLLSLTFYDTKKVSIRKLALNPMLFYTIAATDLREWLYRLCRLDQINLKVWETLNDTQKDLLKPYRALTNSYDPNDLLKAIKDDKKKHDSNYQWWTIASEYLAKYQPLNRTEIDNCVQQATNAQSNSIELDSSVVAANSFVLELAKRYEIELKKKYQNVWNFKLLKKNAKDDNWNLTFDVDLCGINLYQASTSQRILLATRFVKTVLEGNNVPMLIDEAEVFDFNSFRELNMIGNQFLFAKVESQPTKDKTFETIK